MGFQMWTYYMPASLIDDAEDFVRTAQGTDDYAMKMSCLRAAVLLAFASADSRINMLLLKCFKRDGGHQRKYLNRGKDQVLKDIMAKINTDGVFPSEIRYLYNLHNRLEYLKACLIGNGMNTQIAKYSNTVRTYYNPLKHYSGVEDNINPNDLTLDIVGPLVMQLRAFGDKLKEIGESVT